MGFFRRTLGWVSDRLGLRQVADMLMHHRVPPGAARGRSAWLYIFGTATLAAFLLQVVTGFTLATRYVPSPAHAYESVRFMTEDVPSGGFVRAMHYYGASAMVVLVTMHMVRVFLTGSYKFPRELNWLTGVVLLAFTMIMAFTGQLLRWDQNGVWGVFVASQYVGRVPLIGEWLKSLVLGGDTVGGPTLTRFFALHVILLPLMIFAFVGVHLYLVLRHGVSEPPQAGHRTERDSYREWHAQHVEHGGKPYFPYVTWREAVAALLMVVTVMALSFLMGPRGPGEPPDPTAVPAEPKPDWYLLWYYALLALKPGSLETFVMVYLPLLLFALLVALPLIAPFGERSPARRPWAIAVVVLFAIGLGSLTRLGMQANWVMDFEPQPLSAAELPLDDATVADGARVFHAQGCQTCHAVSGHGGSYGPDLVDVAKRLPPEVITARIVAGFGDMPSYRGRISAAELAAIVVFLESLDRQ